MRGQTTRTELLERLEEASRGLLREMEYPEGPSLEPARGAVFEDGHITPTGPDTTYRYGTRVTHLTPENWDGAGYLRVQAGMSVCPQALFDHPTTMHYIPGPAEEISLLFEGDDLAVGQPMLVSEEEAAQSLFEQVRACPSGTVYHVPAAASAVRGTGALKSAGLVTLVKETTRLLNGDGVIASTSPEAPLIEIGGRWTRAVRT